MNNKKCLFSVLGEISPLASAVLMIKACLSRLAANQVISAIMGPYFQGRHQRAERQQTLMGRAACELFLLSIAFARQKRICMKNA